MFQTRTLLALVPVALVTALGGSAACAAEGETAPFFAAITHQDAAAVTGLLDAHPEWANAKNENGQSAVRAALFLSDEQGFKARDRNPVLQAILAKSPALAFFDACAVGSSADVQRFLATDPKLATSWSDFGWSALHFAAFAGNGATAQVLLDHGAEVNARAKTKFRNSTLQVALLVGHADVAKLLLDHGADALVRQSKGFAPIHEAAFLGRQDLIDLLLANGAEINARTNDGRTAVTEALRRKHSETAEYLRSKGGTGAEIIGDLMQDPK